VLFLFLARDHLDFISLILCGSALPNNASDEGSKEHMNSSMIGKIEKAHRYAREPERVRIHSLQATFHGGHDDHSVELRDGHWRCSCHAFSTHVLGTCAHVMAIQQMMSPMLSEDDRYSGDDFAVIPEALPVAN
jgi:hypothetical protein